MKQQTNYHALMRLLVCCLIGFSSLWSYADTDVTIGDLKYSLDDYTKKATVTGPVSKSVNSVVIPERVSYNNFAYSVTSIGESAFRDCSSLTEVAIPNSVTSIRYYAFSGCSSLTEVAIPNSVTSIMWDAFSGCSSLTEVAIPNSVNEISIFAFDGCSSLTEVAIPNSVTSIRSGAFRGCSNLTDVTIPNSVTSIDNDAFRGCSNLTDVTIPNSVTSIDNDAFYGCSSLAEVTIPNSLTSIGDRTFYGCSSLAEVTIGNSVTSIGSSAFYGCSSLTKASFASIESLCKIKFDSATSNPLCYVHHLYIDDKEVTSIIIPETVTSISSYAFYGCSSLTEVTNLNSVTSIGEGAFGGCSSLTEVTIPNSLTSIGDRTFYGCSSLTGVTIPNSVTSIGEYAFYNCSSLKEVTIPNFVTTIGSYAFSGCSSLTEVSIPNSVTSIGDGAFECCSRLTDLTIGNSVTTIGSCAFASCSSLTEVTIPNFVTTLGGGVFNGCSSLVKVTIPNSVTSIGVSAFEGCSSLVKVTIPNSVTSIGESAFRDCSSLTEVTIPNSVTEIGNYAFVNCRSLTEVTIPNSVTSIGIWEFHGCSSLKKISFGNSITSIPEFTFHNCFSLKEVTIGSSVTSIATSAFYDCNSLTSLYFYSGSITEIQNIRKLISKSTDIFCCLNGSISDEIWSLLKYSEKVLVEYNGINYTFVIAPEAFTFTNCIASNDGTSLIDCTKPCIAKSQGDAKDMFFRGKNIAEDLFSENGFSFEPSLYYEDNLFETSGNYFYNLGKTVTLKEAGSLFNEVGLQDIEKVDRLKIRGDINGTDIMTINRMKSLIILDLSSANIVQGGTTYRENLKTANNRIGSYFFNDIQLKVLKLPDSATTIDDSAFNGMSSLEEVKIGDNTKNILASAFLGCKNITELVLPNVVASIGSSAFEGCSSLTEVTIPNSVTAIGNCAFNGCRGLKKLILEEGEKDLSLGYNSYYSSSPGKGLFYDCPLENIYLGRNLSYTTTYQYGYSPFYFKTTLTSLTIGNSVTSIGNYAFNGCTRLTELTIPDSVTSIGEYAFRGCSSLTEVTIPNSVTSISVAAFSGCSGLTSLTLGNSVTSIGGSAFSGCSGLTSLTLGNSVTSIGGSAFSGCSGLKSLTLGTSIKSIGESAFSGCSGLKEVTIPNSVTAISDYTFNGCTGLKNLIIEDGEKTLNLGYNSDSYSYSSIGKGLFFDCPLESVYLGRNLSYETDRKYGYSPFYSNNTLNSLTIGNSVTSIGTEAFSGCTALESAILSNNLTKIQKSTFQNTGLKEIEIPSKVTSIAEDAFRGCSQLEKVILPASLTKAGAYAFGECPAITQVYSLNTTPPVIESSTFDSEVEENATLHVKKGSMVHYWLDPVWKEFKNMNEDLLCLEAIPAATYGDDEIDLSQYAPEDVKLRYETSNSDVIEINGNMMRIVGAGEATVDAILDEEEGTPMELMGQLRQFVVDKADLEITVAEITIEPGQPLPDFSYLAKGLKYDDTLDDIEELPQPMCDVDENSPEGEYPIYFSEGNDRNYNIATRESKVIIDKPTEVNTVSYEMTDSDSEVEVYNLNGMLIYKGSRKEAQLEKGIYIVRQGNVAVKINVQ